MNDEIRKKIAKNRTILVLISVTAIGLLAGLVGGLFAKVYLFENPYNIPFFGDISFADNNYDGANLIIRGAKNVVVEQNVKVAETVNSLNTSLVGVFKKIKNTGEDTSNSVSLQNYYRLDQPVGLGFVITSDGWILTDAISKNLDSNLAVKDYVIISKDKKIYEIDRIVKDSLTSYSFIHIKGVNDLPVLQFAEKKDISRGQLAIAVDWLGSSWLTSVVGHKEKNGVLKSSDLYSDELVLDGSKEAIKEAVVVNLSGNIIAVANNQGEIESISHFQSAIQSLLKIGAVKRARFGVNYISLAYLADESGKYKKGALISKSASGIAIIKNSPADLAGLKEGDIILKVNGAEINDSNDLTDLIQNHSAGERIDLVYVRNGNNLETSVLLVEVK